MKKISLVLCVVVAGFLFLAAGCSKDSEPSKAFIAFNDALIAKEWETVWDMLSSRTQGAFAEEGYKRMREVIEAMPPELRKKKVEGLELTHDQLYDMKPKQFFLFIMKKTEASQAFVKAAVKPEIKKAEVEGDKATLFLKGKNEYVCLIKEDGKWKIDFEAD